MKRNSTFCSLVAMCFLWQRGLSAFAGVSNLSAANHNSVSSSTEGYRLGFYPTCGYKDNLEMQKAKRLQLDPETKMNVSQLITSKGFPCEDHYVETKDGYILSMQRIPHGRNNTSFNGSRPVVYLQHGLLGDATNFLTNLVDQSLAFILADDGYDVWLGNCRGSTYSRGHVKLSAEEKSFWEFSWDEMAKYDLPAFINYALEVTGQSQLFYIGHSQGTTVAFAAFSENPQLAKKVKLFTALAPVATVGYNESPIRILADSDIYKGIDVVLSGLGMYDFLPQSKLIELFGHTVCGNEKTVIVCESLIFMVGGFDCHRMNASRVPVYVTHSPAGTSVRNMAHWAQMIKSHKFQKYDYGIIGNLRHYNTLHAPEYDVRKMEVPTAVFTGDWDILADPKDVELLIPKIKNLVHSQSIPKFDHIDFIWAVDAAKVLYQDLLKVMQKF